MTQRIPGRRRKALLGGGALLPLLFLAALLVARCMSPAPNTDGGIPGSAVQASAVALPALTGVPATPNATGLAAPADSATPTRAIRTAQPGAGVASAGAASAVPARTATPTAPAAAGASLPSGVKIATPLPGERLATIAYGQLPSQARDVILLIAHNGPFKYTQDGVVFQNRETLLPRKAAGYYHEYTVQTPGSPDRGARRLITGAQNEMYYTDDHYASFRRVVP
jgi:ribonuclease T1